jgi:hypothetical protein
MVWEVLKGMSELHGSRSQEVKQDLAVSMHLMIAFQVLLKLERQLADEIQRLNVAFIGAYSLITCAGSF